MYEIYVLARPKTTCCPPRSPAREAKTNDLSKHLCSYSSLTSFLLHIWRQMHEELEVVLVDDSPPTLYRSPKTQWTILLTQAPLSVLDRGLCSESIRGKEACRKQETLRKEMLYLITPRVTVLFYTCTRYSLLPTCGVAMPRAETLEYIIHRPSPSTMT